MNVHTSKPWQIEIFHRNATIDGCRLPRHESLAKNKRNRKTKTKKTAVPARSLGRGTPRPRLLSLGLSASLFGLGSCPKQHSKFPVSRYTRVQSLPFPTVAPTLALPQLCRRDSEATRRRGGAISAASPAARRARRWSPWSASPLPPPTPPPLPPGRPTPRSTRRSPAPPSRASSPRSNPPPPLETLSLCSASPLVLARTICSN
jgi:hypothetical protein